MNPDELLKKIIAYGGDEDGINDRFAGNTELYKACFDDFLVEPNFASLGEAMAAKNYESAFSSAHALKGVSGNLGLTEFYTAICVLVESLRAKDYENIASEYSEVLKKKEKLIRLFSDEEPVPSVSPEVESVAEVFSEKAPKIESSEEPKAKNRRLLLMSIAAILGSIAAVCILFLNIGKNFSKNIITESGQHLSEMSNQIRLYVDEQLSNDWNIAESVADSFNGGAFSDEESILGYMRRKQKIWTISDIMVYTENGFCINSNGETYANDIASEIASEAIESGKLLSVRDSDLIYTIPVETELELSGSKIVAVSVVQNMETFLDEMNFDSFCGEAWMYLTQENGIVLSSLTNKHTVPVFNFRAILDGSEVEALGSGFSPSDLLNSEDTASFLLTNGSGEATYVVSVPIKTGSMPLRLFYLAPEDVVNNASNGFFRQLTFSSIAIISLFAVLSFFSFFFIYRSRAKFFNKALLAREHMFDLLVKHTKTAFALFSANRQEPVYISHNAPDLIGDKYWALDRDSGGYRLRSSTGKESYAIRTANEMLVGWDGKTSFESGYILNSLAVPPHYFEYRLFPINGEGSDFVGIAQDVTLSYEREKATITALEMAKRANESKSRFLSNMSHDIRTPMNAIINMTDFALESIDDPKLLGTYLHTIKESSEHLLHLINDVLDMSRIESGENSVASAPFNIRDEIRTQVDMIRPLAAAKGQTLIADYDDFKTASVSGDALKLSQIVANLLSNAVKFTPEKGAVRLTAKEIPSLREDIADVRIIVEDNGIGISEENLKSIFNPFFRGDDKRVGRIEGTGLGLSICKSYVEAMGGTIRCESEEGEGSTFTVELFFKKAKNQLPDNSRTAINGTPFLGMHCLVIEDNPTNQLIAKSLLERLGFIVDIASDGGEGVSAFLRAKPGTYDVIYMDIQMPVLDGYQASAAIRQSEHPSAESVPIVAMTANVFAEDIEKARVAGMDAYLGKPIVSFNLIDETNKAINRKRGQQK